MRYPLVVFDFDGTLADSLGPALAVLQPHRPRAGAEVDRGPGGGPVDADPPSCCGSSASASGDCRGWSGRSRPRPPSTPASCGCTTASRRCCAGLSVRGHRLGILSSNREDVIRACLRANGVEELFAFVVGYPKLFGKAKALRRILKVEKVDRGGLLFVGDELRDLEAGRKAKVATVAVTWGFQSEPLLQTGGATYLARRPDEVLALVDLS